MMSQALMRRKILPDRAGFSLVEIMIVITLFGILVTVSAPPMFQFIQSHRLQTSSDRMIADLQYTRTLAISNGAILRFAATEGGYQVTNPVTGDVIRRRDFDDGLALAAAVTTDFFPWGMANAATFDLQSGSQTRQIQVLPTGLVEVP